SFILEQRRLARENEPTGLVGDIARPIANAIGAVDFALSRSMAPILRLAAEQNRRIASCQPTKRVLADT
ncbi:hypothetical protein ABTH17_19120, partial [Acinetobacter baumannii]